MWIEYKFRRVYYLLFALARQAPVNGSASLIRGGGAKMISRKAGSLKQLAPEYSNFLHLASVLLAKANATCLDTLGIPFLEARFPRVAC